MLFEDEPLDWQRFQQAGPHTQGNMIVALMNAARRAKDDDYVQVECRYVTRVEPEPDEDAAEFEPICLVGWCLFELQGMLSGYASRTDFLRWLATRSSMNDEIGKSLGLHPATVVSLVAAQESADNGATWKVASTIGERTNFAALRYCQDH